MQNPSHWEDYLYLDKFAYNNEYHASTIISSFEALYGRKCITQVTWDGLVDRLMFGPDLLKDLEYLVEKVKQNFK